MVEYANTVQHHLQKVLTGFLTTPVLLRSNQILAQSNDDLDLLFYNLVQCMLYDMCE